MWSWEELFNGASSIIDSVGGLFGDLDESIGQVLGSIGLDSFGASENKGEASVLGGLGNVWDDIWGTGKNASTALVDADTGAVTPDQSEGLMQRTVGWIEKNPKSAQLAAGLIAGAYQGYQKDKDREWAEQMYERKVRDERESYKEKLNYDYADKRKNYEAGFNFSGAK